MSEFIKFNFEGGSEFVCSRKEIVLRKGLAQDNKFFVALKIDMSWCEITREEYERICKELGIE